MKMLAKKLEMLLKEGLHVEKRGYNSFHKYNYATEADVLEAIDKALNKHGILSFMTMEDATIVNNGEKPLTRVKMKFTLLDPDSGEVMESIFFGDGEDKGDKGIYKAITGAQKYYFMKNFRIATGDDPEKVEEVQVSKPAYTKQESTQPAKSSFRKPGPAVTAATPEPKQASSPNGSGGWE